MKYLSQEWLDAVKKKGNTDEAYLKKAKGLTVKTRTVVTDCPDGIDLLMEWELEDGKIVKLSREQKPAPSEWRQLTADPKYISTVVGYYEAFVKLNKKEITPMQALSTKIYKVHGDLAKIMAKMGQFNAIAELQTTVPCEY